MSPSQYELQYGRIPDDEVIIPGFDEGGDMDMSQMDDTSGIDDSMGGFGAHFLLTNGQEGDNGLMQQVYHCVLENFVLCNKYLS